MGTFSPIHGAIAMALLAALGGFVYLLGSLLWAGAKTQGRGKLMLLAVLLPLAVLAVLGMVESDRRADQAQPAALPADQAGDDEWWKKGGTPVN